MTTDTLTNDTVHDYEVTVHAADGESFSSVIDVRLTFPSADNIGQHSDRAKNEAAKRALKLARRDYPALVADHQLVADQIEWLGSSLVRHGQRPRRRK